MYQDAFSNRIILVHECEEIMQVPQNGCLVRGMTHDFIGGTCVF